MIERFPPNKLADRLAPARAGSDGDREGFEIRKTLFLAGMPSSLRRTKKQVSHEDTLMEKLCIPQGRRRAQRKKRFWTHPPNRRAGMIEPANGVFGFNTLFRTIGKTMCMICQECINGSYYLKYALKRTLHHL
jgi:hypothetical protein